MSQQFLDRKEPHPVLIRLRGERVPQAVRRELPAHRPELLLDPDGLHHPADLEATYKPI